MEVCTHLVFGGQCEAAFKFYERCVGARISFLMRYSESPGPSIALPHMGDKIFHASLMIGEERVTGADDPSGAEPKHQGFSLALHLDDPAKAERIFAELAVNGQVHLALQETFWAARFGMLTDGFGIPWMINCGKSA